MKKILNFTVFVIAAFALFTACEVTTDDTTTSDVIACFNYSPTTELTAGTEITFTNCSENATNFAWNFGDGTVSTEENPVHAFKTPGEYPVQLVAANETSADTVLKTITIVDNSSEKTLLLCKTWIPTGDWTDGEESGNWDEFLAESGALAEVIFENNGTLIIRGQEVELDSEGIWYLGDITETIANWRWENEDENAVIITFEIDGETYELPVSQLISLTTENAEFSPVLYGDVSKLRAK